MPGTDIGYNPNVYNVGLTDLVFSPRMMSLIYLQTLQPGQPGISSRLAPCTRANGVYTPGTMLAQYSAAHPQFPYMLVNFDPASADAGQAIWNEMIVADSNIQFQDINVANVLSGMANNLCRIAVGGEFYLAKLSATAANLSDVVPALNASSDVKTLNGIVYLNIV